MVEVCAKVGDIWEISLPFLREALLKRYFTCIAMRRLTATAIAIKQYELDTGSLPAKLTDLVPKYLAGVPVDPFSDTGNAIKLGSWGGRRLIYSVGVNGLDQLGEYGKTADEVDAGGNFDIPFFLDGDRPFGPLPGMPTSLSAAGATGP